MTLHRSLTNSEIHFSPIRPRQETEFSDGPERPTIVLDEGTQLFDQQLLEDSPIAANPDIFLAGPELLETSDHAGDPVDGVAVMVYGPQAKTPHLVYVSEGLCQLVGKSSEQLLGQSPIAFLADEVGQAELDAIARAIGPKRRDAEILELVDHDVEVSSSVMKLAVSTSESAARQAVVVDHWSREHGDWAALGGRGGSAPYIDAPYINRPSTGDLDQSESLAVVLDDSPKVDGYKSCTHVLDGNGLKVPVYLTAHTIPSSSTSNPSVVLEFRDLRRESAERLIADREAVVGSLRRGHQLGQLCHQVAVMIERSLGVSATCWITVTSPDGTLEPVITGGFDPQVVAATTDTIAKSSSRPTKRVASVRGLPTELADSLRDDGITNLWYLPVSSDTARPALTTGAEIELDAALSAEVSDSGPVQTGAIVVATGRSTPDREATMVLEHLSNVLGAAIDHASVESDLTHNSLHDPLTRLPNRALIVDRLSQAMARLERDGVALSVLLVDIDRFKALNDSRGVEAGDKVLTEVADRLLTAVRLGDTVGRVSSDQFLVMCVAGTGDLDTTAVARRILKSISEPIKIGDGDPIRITASVGAVIVDEKSGSPNEVISNAESALALAAEAGRGQFAMFQEDRQHDVVVRHQTEQALHRALAQDEMVMYYQPMVEIKTGFMIGAEALIRWDRPGHGLLGPGQFIPIAEESELIVTMGEWVIDKVCEDLAAWPKARGRSPIVSINLAVRHLEVDTLVPTVIRALQRNGLHPTRLGFEITESMEISDLNAVLVNLNRLSELGCRIAIDDFGVGHASLDYLRRFPMATALKIDRSFVDGLNKSREDTAIVKASLGMAQSLGLQSVAEGVETVEQLLALRDLGCRYAQGFVLSKPLPFDIVLQLWEHSRMYGAIGD